MQPSSNDVARRDEVIGRIVDAIKANVTIKLPSFDPASSQSGEFALHLVEENDFSGSVGPYRYQFEGEDDLLHLIVARANGSQLTVEEGREVAAFLLPNVSPAVVWLKPGELTQHFYLGHDELLN